MPYLRTGLDRDPLSPAKALHAASAAGSLGLTAEAAARHARLYDRWYSASTWTDYLAAAIFRGVGDVDALLADPPSNLPSQSLACWTDIAKAQRSSDRTARRRGAARAAQCQANGAIRVDLALLASAFLGDLDRTFLLADGVQDQILRDRGFAETLFDPRLSALRADARFAPLMERQQLVAYWRDSGNRPDFCRVEKAPVCLMISKGAQALR